MDAAGEREASIREDEANLGFLIRMGLLRQPGSYQLSTAGSTSVSRKPYLYPCSKDTNEREQYTEYTSKSSANQVAPPPTNRQTHPTPPFSSKAGPDTLHQSQQTRHVLLVQTRLLLQTRDVRTRALLLGSEPHPDTLQEAEYLADDQDGRGV
jgi:hypothetical protein